MTHGSRALRPDDDPGWASYAETILRIHTDPPLEIVLSAPVTPALRVQLARVGLPGPFGTVTPCNPYGHRADPAENADRLERFLAELTMAGERVVRIDGCSPDGCHLEPGVALSWPRSRVVALARRWEQSAIYWWDGEAFWVVGALTSAAPWRLGGGP